jgi:hypothetical protein
MPEISAAEYMAKKLPADMVKKLNDLLKGLPETGIPALSDPEADRIVDEEKKRLMQLDVAAGVPGYTYGLSPEQIAVKQKYAELWDALKKWRDEALARLKAKFAAEKEIIGRQYGEKITTIGAEVKPEKAWETMVPVYEQFATTYGQALDKYTEARNAVHEAYVAAFLASMEDYTTEFYAPAAGEKTGEGA